jgi:hypothetical protein
MSERIFRTPAPAKAVPDLIVAPMTGGAPRAGMVGERMGATIPANDVKNLPNAPLSKGDK